MSLLQNEEFAIYQLRTSYLASIHDGVGERLINVNANFLNDPGFRAAGWNPNPPELKRTYSPPIPTAITSEYFKAPPRTSSRADFGSGEEDEEGGMITGGGSTETVGPSVVARRRRRREQLEEDDSSDLSDESDEEQLEPTQRPATQVRFETVTSRARAESSPLRSSSKHEGPSFLITSPSRPPTHTRLKDGSFNSAKARTRRNTTTSSEVPSENELDPSLFKRRQIQANIAKSGGNLADQIKEDQEAQPDQQDSDGEPLIEEIEEDEEEEMGDEEVREDEVDEDARSADSDDDSSLASGFSETVDSHSILEGASSALRAPELPSIITGDSDALSTASPKRNKQPPATLPELPPPRPISTIQPISALAEAIKAKNKKPTSPFDRFATLSGRGETNPLQIKMYLPPSTEASEPLEILLKRATDGGANVTVGEAIGFALWRYGDEGLKPPISKNRMNVNWWTLRIVEDEEVDFDFPPLGRTRPMTDFTSNNNRPARGRGRGKAWDEFALVEATDMQFQENEKATPIFSKQAKEVQQDDQGESPPDQKPQRPEAVRIPSDNEISRSVAPRRNVVTDPMYVTAGMRKDGITGPLDTPTAQVSHATPRSGAPKTLQIHYSDANMMSYVTPIEVTTDTYLAEVFDQICKKLNVDKALYVLKVSRTTTIAPSDRTVEALGPERQSLDLVRRRFVGHGTFGLSGSPGSTSPNAPLFLTTTSTPKKSKKPVSSHPLAQQAEMSTGTALTAYNKRYNVIRKQPMSFTPSQQRMLAFDGEYMHIMPSDTGKERLLDATPGKTTSVHFSSVVGCKINRKHPKTFRVVVFKERESKRYDFEAGSAFEAAEIVHEIKKGIEPYRDTVT